MKRVAFVTEQDVVVHPVVPDVQHGRHSSASTWQAAGQRVAAMTMESIAGPTATAHRSDRRRSPMRRRYQLG